MHSSNAQQTVENQIWPLEQSFIPALSPSIRQTEESIIQVIIEETAKLLDLSPDHQLSETTSLLRDVDLDSGMFIELMFSIEDRIPSFKYEPEKIERSAFSTIGSLASFVRSHSRGLEI